MGKWRFLCKCGDGSAFFEHKATGEIMNWFVSNESISISACQYFGCSYKHELATKENHLKRPNNHLHNR